MFEILLKDYIALLIASHKIFYLTYSTINDIVNSSLTGSQRLKSPLEGCYSLLINIL